MSWNYSRWRVGSLKTIKVQFAILNSCSKIIFQHFITINWKKSYVQALNFSVNPQTGTSPNWYWPQLALPQLELPPTDTSPTDTSPDWHFSQLTLTPTSTSYNWPLPKLAFFAFFFCDKTILYPMYNFKQFFIIWIRHTEYKLDSILLTFRFIPKSL